MTDSGNLLLDLLAPVLFAFGILFVVIPMLVALSLRMLQVLFPPMYPPPARGFRFRLTDLLVAVIFHAAVLAILSQWASEPSTIVLLSICLLVCTLGAFAVAADGLERTARRYSPAQRALVLAGYMVAFSALFPFVLCAWMMRRDDDELLQPRVFVRAARRKSSASSSSASAIRAGWILSCWQDTWLHSKSAYYQARGWMRWATSS